MFCLFSGPQFCIAGPAHKSNPPRRPPQKLTGRKASSPGTNGSQPSASTGADRRAAQGPSQQEAEIVLTVLRGLRKGNFFVRVPPTSSGGVGKAPGGGNRNLQAQ